MPKYYQSADNLLRTAEFAAGAGSWRWDPSSDELEASDECRSLLGLPPDDPLTMANLRAAIHPEDLARTEAALQQAIANRSGFECEFRIVLPDGALRALLARGRMLENTGELAGIFLERSTCDMKRDWWGRRLDRVAPFLDDAPVGMAFVDVEFRYRYVNRELADIDGIPAASHLGRTIEELLPDLWPQVRPHLEGIRKSRAAACNVEISGHTNYPTAAMRWWSANYYPVFGDDGELAGIGLVVSDIAESKRIAEALKDNDERLQFVLDTAQLGTWQLDTRTGVASGDIRHSNILGSSQKLQNWSLERFLERVHPDDRSMVRDKIQQTELHGSEMAFECRIVWPDNTIHWVWINGAVYRGQSGETERLLGTIMDVTHRKLAEHALLQSEKLASAGRMAATVAHEINNPLAAVTNLLFLLASDETLSPKARAYVRIAEEEMDRITHISRQTLGFYRERGAVLPTRLSEIVEQLLSLLNKRIKVKQIKVRKLLANSGLAAVIPGEIRQVFSNLISNAIEALPEGGELQLRVSRPLNLCDRKYIRFTVADNGVGIPSGSLARIFEPFFTTKLNVGTGLGLWVTREIVQHHGGSIRVRSREGTGTVFAVFLPAHESKAEHRYRADTSA